MAMADNAAVQREIAELGQRPVTDEERKVACRAIVRFKGQRQGNDEEDTQIEVTEDWVRLYVALRRASGSSTMRLSASQLRRWKAKVSQSTTVKRKVFIVKKAALERLPAYPEDLDKWLIPRGELELPADIHGDDDVFIDDGYDRSKLNMPGILHLEVAVRWSREKRTGGRSSGLSLTDDGSYERPLLRSLPSISDAGSEISEQPAAPALQQPAAAAPAAEQTAPPAAAPAAEQTLPAPAVGESEGSSEPEKAMADIISQTVKALGCGRWVSNDSSLPNTVEFWVRLFTNDMTKKPKEETKLTEPQKGFVKYITKSLYESDCGYSNLRFVVPHIVKLQQWSSELVPPLATVLCRLSEVDLEQPASLELFHKWLQQDFSLSQMQTVYNSVMYAGFLKKRVGAQLKKAQEDMTARETLLPLLEASAADSLEMAAELKIVRTLEDTTVKLKQKVDLLWSTPSALEIVTKWAGLKDAWSKYMPFAKDAEYPQASGQTVTQVYEVMGKLEDGGIVDVPNVALKSLFAESLRVRGTGNAFLLRCFHEQIVARAGATATEITDLNEDMDISDCKDVAKELSKQWIAAVKKDVSKFPLLKALQDAFSRNLKRNRSDAAQENAKGAAAPAAAAPAVKEESGDAAAPAVEEEAGDAAAPAVQEEAGDAAAPAVKEQAGDAAAPAGKEEALHSEAAEEDTAAEDEAAGGPKDQGGKVLKKDGIVVLTAKKQKEFYNGFKGKIIRINSQHVVLDILEGPAKGEKRKVLFTSVNVVDSVPAKKPKIEKANSSASGAASSAAAAPAATQQEEVEEEEDEKPDDKCMALFGDLNLF